MSSDPLNRRLEVICSRQRRSARRRSAVKRRSGGYSVFDQPAEGSGSTAGRSPSAGARLMPRVSPPRRLQLAAVGAAAGILAMTALAIEWQRPAPPAFLLADKPEDAEPAATGAGSHATAETSPTDLVATATAGPHETTRSAQRFAARTQVGVQADHSPYSGLDFAEDPPVAARRAPSPPAPGAVALPAPAARHSRRAEGLRRRLLQPHPADFHRPAPLVSDGSAEAVPGAVPPDGDSRIGESSRWPRRNVKPVPVEVSPVVPSPQSLQIPQLPPAAGSESEPPRPALQQPAPADAPPADGTTPDSPARPQQPTGAAGVQFPSLPALPPVVRLTPGSTGNASTGTGSPETKTQPVPQAATRPAADVDRQPATDRAEQISVHSRTAAQDRLRRLALTRLQAARMALKRGELQAARSIARDTQQLKVLYGLFDDRPDLVLQDIEQLERQFDTPKAETSSSGRPPLPAPSEELPAGTVSTTPQPSTPQPTSPVAVPARAASPRQLRELQQLQRESLGTLIQSTVEPVAPAPVRDQPQAAPIDSRVPALVSPPAKPIEPMLVPDQLPDRRGNSSTPDSLDAAEAADSPVNSAGWRRTDLSFQFDQVPWPTVLQQLSDVTGLKLDMPVAPPGTLTYHNPRTYAPREVVRILNLMLTERGFQLYRSGNRLVVRSLAGNTAN